MRTARTLLRRNARLVVIVPFAVLLGGASPALATPLFLGSAQSYAVLGASAVTNTGPTTLTGDLGISPGPAGIVGFFGTAANDGPGLASGAKNENNAAAALAQSDALTADNILAGLPVTMDLTGHDLGTSGTLPLGTLNPGVYKFSSSAQLNGTLLLDFGTHPDQPFVFQIGSTLTTASASTVTVLNGSSISAVYWDVGSSATLGSSTTFAGNILADQSITLITSAKILCGRAIALNAAVKLDTNTISTDCTNVAGRSDFSSLGFSGPISGSTSPVPEPASALLLITGLISVAALRRARAQ
jgi:hypothetical protein